MAAKSLENASGILAQNIKNYKEAASLYNETSLYYQAIGSPDKAVEMLEKGAK